MDQGTEPIRQDIDQIRASMTDKMEKIEAKIKGTVDETTGSVKRMVDVKYQVSEHPWTALGISILAGIALGSIGDSDASQPSHKRLEYRDDNSNEAAYERARTMSTYPANYGASSYGQANTPSYAQNYGSYGQGSYGSSSSGQGSYGSSSYSTPGYGSSSHDRSYGQEHSQPYTSQQPYSSTPSYGSQQPYGTGQSFGTGQSYGSTNYGQSSYTPSSFSQPGSSWNSGSSQSSKPGVMDQLSRQFGGEIETLKSAAVSSLVSVIRDTIRQNFPSMHQEMERMRSTSGATSGSSNWSSTGSTSGSSSYSPGTFGTSGMSSTDTGASDTTDYAHSAVNNPSHVTGISDPARTSGSYETKNSNPDDLQRGSSNL